MIVLDEAVHDPDIIRAISAWYVGRVLSLTTLRPRTVIKDEAIYALLRSVPQPTFVTINVDDFWRAASSDLHYCIVCASLSAVNVAPALPGWLRRLFSLPEFKTKSARMGKIARLSARQIAYYETDRRIRTLSWPN